MAKEHKFVLPSGVEMVVRSLTGKDQGTITKQNDSTATDKFNQMLADCTISIGNDSNITKKNIERMLEKDRKYALVELRQFSLRYKDVFKFNYEWPITGGKKEIQPYEVSFSRDSFPVVAYKWVRDRVDSIKKENPDYNAIEFPVMYESYKDMLDENLIQHFFTEDGQKVEWNICTCEDEARFSGLRKQDLDINVHLKMRNPKVVLVGTYTQDNKEIKHSWNFDNADIYDVEAFRTKYKEIEADIDTSLTIQHQTDSNRVARVDLIGTIDFFFPSQAI